MFSSHERMARAGYCCSADKSLTIITYVFIYIYIYIYIYICVCVSV